MPDVKKTILFDNEKFFDKEFELFKKRLTKFKVNLLVTKNPVPLTVDGQKYAGLELHIHYDLPVIKYGSYVYVATFRKSADIEDDHQVFAIDMSEDFSKYFAKPFHCDHCGINRYRLKVHLFRNKKGKEKMIATTCSKDYFGIETDRAIKGLFSSDKILGKLFVKTDKHTKFRKCWSYKPLIDKKVFSELIFASIMENKGIYNRYLLSTVYRYISFNHAENSYFYNRKKDLEKLYKSLKKKLNYKKLLEFWEKKANDNPKDNYIHNIKVSFYQINPNLNDIATGVFNYMKEDLGLFEQFEQPKIIDINNYVPESVGKEYKINAVITNIYNGRHSFYGNFVVINFLDSKGHKLYWITNKCDYKIGDKIKLSGIIKKFDDYKGIKQTKLTKCKMDAIV